MKAMTDETVDNEAETAPPPPATVTYKVPKELIELAKVKEAQRANSDAPQQRTSVGIEDLAPAEGLLDEDEPTRIQNAAEALREPDDELDLAREDSNTEVSPKAPAVIVAEEPQTTQHQRPEQSEANGPSQNALMTVIAILLIAVGVLAGMLIRTL